MIRPSFQFYVGDWRRNTNLSRCTFAEKGMWIEFLCRAHDNDEYGILRWPLKEIATSVGCKLSELESLIEKGVLKGADKGETCQAYIYTPRHAGKDGPPITLIEEQPGPLWYSSRMVKDDYVGKNRGKGTRFGEKSQGDEPKHEPPPEATPTRRIGDGSIPEPNHWEGDGPSIFSLQSSDLAAVASGRVKDVGRVRRYATTLFPELTAKESGIISVWLTDGCDIELDILPALDLVAVRKQKPGSFGYFTKMIAEGKASRTGTMPAPAAKQPRRQPANFEKQDYTKGTEGFQVVGGGSHAE